MWAAFVAVILGVLVAGATSGSAPSLAFVAALLAIPSVITLLVRLRARTSRGGRDTRSAPIVARPPSRRSRDTRHPPAGPPSVETNSAAFAGAAWDDASAIGAALDSRQLDWLRSNDFTTPWLHGRARPALELGSLVARSIGEPFDGEVKGALLDLSAASERFAEFYRENTSPDPMLRGDEWYFFEWSDDGQLDEGAEGKKSRADLASELHYLSARLAEAYDSFIATVRANPAVESGKRRRSA